MVWLMSAGCRKKVPLVHGDNSFPDSAAQRLSRNLSKGFERIEKQPNVVDTIKDIKDELQMYSHTASFAVNRREWLETLMDPEVETKASGL